MTGPSSTHRGSCLCGAVQFTLASEPRAVAHCHCRMCQKQHGAAFATYGSVPRKDLHYVVGEDMLTSYRSSATIVRRFCRRTGPIQDAGARTPRTPALAARRTNCRSKLSRGSSSGRW